MAVTVEGHVHVTATDAETGEIVQEVDSDNLIVNDGLEMFAKLLINRDMPPWYVEVGEGDTPTTPLDTALDTPFAAINPGGVAIPGEGQVQRLGYLTAGNDVTITTQIDPETPFSIRVNIKALFSTSNFGLQYLRDKTIKEYGLFNRAFGGKMFARVVPTEQITIASFPTKINYQVDWVVTFAFGTSALENGGIVQNGLNIVSDAIKLIKSGIPNDRHIQWGLTHIDLGRDDGGIISESQQLNDPITAENGSRRITINDIDLTDPASPVVIMQRYIGPAMIGDEIKEAGLFNHHTENPLDELLGSSLEKIDTSSIFARVLVDPPLPANTEAVLTFRLLFSRKED